MKQIILRPNARLSREKYIIIIYAKRIVMKAPLSLMRIPQIRNNIRRALRRPGAMILRR